MTIEFRCSHCEKILRTADDKAGVQANCPGCGKLVTVPGDSAPELQSGPTPASFPEPEVEVGFDPLAGGMARSCPMCGASNSQGELRCRVCAENLNDTPTSGEMPDRVVTLDVGQVLDATWRLFQAKLGLCAISGLLVMVGHGILMFLGIGGYIALLVVAGVDQDGPEIDPSPGLMIGMFSAGFGFLLIYFLASVYFTLGHLNLMLKIAKGEPAELTDMFRVGKFFWRGSVAAVIYVLAISSGMCLLLLPGIYLLFMFGQSGLILLDQDVGAIESLKRSYSLTKGNLLTIFLLYVIVCALSFACSMVCSVLNVFTVSFAMLLAAVVYQMVMGRSVART